MCKQPSAPLTRFMLSLAKHDTKSEINEGQIAGHSQPAISARHIPIAVRIRDVVSLRPSSFKTRVHEGIAAIRLAYQRVSADE
jgi:hypothetical protein